MITRRSLRVIFMALALAGAVGCERERAAASPPPSQPPPAPSASKARLTEPETCEVGATEPCEGEFCEEHQVPEAECKECLSRAGKSAPAGHQTRTR